MNSFERNYPRILAGFYFLVLAVFISVLKLPTRFPCGIVGRGSHNGGSDRPAARNRSAAVRSEAGK